MKSNVLHPRNVSPPRTIRQFYSRTVREGGQTDALWLYAVEDWRVRRRTTETSFRKKRLFTHIVRSPKWLYSRINDCGRACVNFRLLLLVFVWVVTGREGGRLRRRWRSPRQNRHPAASLEREDFHVTYVERQGLSHGHHSRRIA